MYDYTQIYITEEMAEKSPAENIHELYRLLLQRNALENALGGIPLEHLMIRKSQRSPSLRLRFGRSGPHVSVSLCYFRPHFNTLQLSLRSIFF
ncbi:hypothetical protein X777_06488 [Ooceraea biroi]|uniref:Uncharacterized protein n=1 Tax=Ooceraea biroi TaxID=2015173 RepID=A0A026WBE0_OOCBI|nr:hypothetical protein X777_06488 [Ooceraea biroi]